MTIKYLEKYTKDNIPKGTERIGGSCFAYKTIDGVPHWTCTTSTGWEKLKEEHREKYLLKSVPVQQYLEES